VNRLSALGLFKSYTMCLTQISNEVQMNQATATAEQHSLEFVTSASSNRSYLQTNATNTSVISDKHKSSSKSTSLIC